MGERVWEGRAFWEEGIVFTPRWTGSEGEAGSSGGLAEPVRRTPWTPPAAVCLSLVLPSSSVLRPRR